VALIVIIIADRVCMSVHPSVSPKRRVVEKIDEDLKGVSLGERTLGKL
jgi:hypothetical protein